jgi:uncharacterized membrane protein (DUF485 family)
MYRQTYLPIYCMFYAIGVITAIRFGRGMNGDWTWLTSEWYNFHLTFFAFGVVWILLYALVEHLRRIRVDGKILFKFTWPVAFSLVALAFILASHGYANVAQWQRSPSVYAWLAEKRNAMLFPDLYDDPAGILLGSKSDVAESRAILEKYKLSCFSPKSLAEFYASSRNGLIYVSGWWDDGWVSHRGNIFLTVPAEDDISFDGFLPSFIPSNHVEVKLNGNLIFDGTITDGEHATFSGHLQKGTNLISVICDKEVVPASIGANGDLRPLAFHLTFTYKYK